MPFLGRTLGRGPTKINFQTQGVPVTCDLASALWLQQHSERAFFWDTLYIIVSRYLGEDITVHEFAHSLMLLGFTQVAELKESDSRWELKSNILVLSHSEDSRWELKSNIQVLLGYCENIQLMVSHLAFTSITSG